ncbi:hypothetical protein [Nonomuraea sp. NPDC005650]|uniref:hypothetical protein n=1 Tax=Nonomuraea sp. NPDC005650 TaxID=3157045 RepID=UPI0033BD32DA
MALIMTCRSVCGAGVVRGFAAGMAATVSVLAAIALAGEIPELLWLTPALMPLYLLLALPIGALASRLAKLPAPGRTATSGWLIALAAGQVLAWVLPSGGHDAAAGIFVLGPSLALLVLPVGFALVALRGKRYHIRSRSARQENVFGSPHRPR